MNIQSDSTKVTFTQVYQDVKQGLQGLGEALKTGAEHVYEILIKQQFVESITWLIVILILSIASFVLLKFGLNDMWNIRKDYYGQGEHLKEVKESRVALLVFGAACGLSAAICFMINANDIITGFVNPEYGAMKEIMEFVK